MAGRKRRMFTQEFKLDAVRLATASGQSLAKIERDLGLSSALLGRWVKEYEQKGEEAFLNHRRTKTEKARVRELERRIAVLEEEREILKKAVAIFSQEKE